MFRQFFVGVLALTFVSVQANAATGNSLKAAFDELNYALTVEGNGNDVAFRNEQMKKFGAKVELMQKNEGLTDAQLVDFTVSQIKDAAAAKDLKNAYAMIKAGQLAPKQAVKLAVDTLSKTYNHGASWTGDEILYGGIIILVIVVALAGSNGGGSYSGGYYDYYDYNDYWYYDCYDYYYC